MLDLCTGTGTVVLKFAAGNSKVKVFGVDRSAGMLRVARHKRGKQRIKNLKLCLMDATQLGFQDKNFDKVLISLVLHEMEEEFAEKLILEAKRVLKDEGEFTT